MPLSSGARLGPYEIQAAIGAGGMGEVYKARDTRLDRTVAIKVLPAELSADPERRARFEREAKTIAGLTHPHICTLYDVGEHDGTTFLVMEHLPGQTLADRLLKGPLPLAQALDIATQIADALAAAHKHGIIHRDLKPGNVMLTGGGSGRSGVTSAKLLDFGLAKLVAHGEQPALASGASAATQSLPMTVRGTIVGTLQYMAPEQLEGKEADARTDLWALGALLYEMVTGKRAFQADSDVSLIGAILNTEPAGLATLQPLTPPSLERLVKKCLAKHPDDRWDTAHDVADELRWIHGNGPAGAGAFVQPPSWHGFWLAGGALVLVAATAAIMWLALGRRTQPDLVVRSAVIGIQPADALLGGISAGSSPTVTRNRPSQTALAMTRDGRRLVFAAREGSRVQLYVRDVWGRAVTATAIPNTDGADAPVLSPDDQWVAFWVPAAKSADGWVLKRTPLDGGGTPVEICRAAVPMGASWGDDGHIVFSENETAGLRRVSIDGGTPTVVTDLKPGEASHRLPHVLPGSRAVLFTVLEQVYNWDTARVVAYRLGDKAWTEVVRGAADARYLPTGHLIFFRRGRLMAVGFNLEQLKKTGNEVGLEGDVLQNTNGINTPTDSGAAQVAVSSSGTLAYVAGGEVPDVNRRLVWVDRQGRVDALDVPPKPVLHPTVVPGRAARGRGHLSERATHLGARPLEAQFARSGDAPGAWGDAAALVPRWAAPGVWRVSDGPPRPVLDPGRRLPAATRAAAHTAGRRFVPGGLSCLLGAGRTTRVRRLQPGHLARHLAAVPRREPPERRAAVRHTKPRTVAAVVARWPVARLRVRRVRQEPGVPGAVSRPRASNAGGRTSRELARMGTQRTGAVLRTITAAWCRRAGGARYRTWRRRRPEGPGAVPPGHGPSAIALPDSRF